MKEHVMKESFFKVRGNIWQSETDFRDEFNIFIKGIDDRHAVLMAKYYLRKNAPSKEGKLLGKIIIEGVEERKV